MVIEINHRLNYMVEHARNIRDSEAIILLLGCVCDNLKGMSQFVQSKALKVINRCSVDKFILSQFKKVYLKMPFLFTSRLLLALFAISDCVRLLT